jgi:SAM-dependent methyltransferase
LKFGKYIPYFKVNSNQEGATKLVERYVELLKKNCSDLLHLNDLRILEIGAGTTNTVGLLLAEKLGCKVDVCDPYVIFDYISNKKNIAYYGISKSVLSSVKRIDKPNEKAYDLIISNSVLEHVEVVNTFFKEMKQALKKTGKMFHIVDYRDHFFKYPYFFLIFSKKIWNRWLNPGDLFRWRLDDHINSVLKSNLRVKILEEKKLEQELFLINKKLIKYFY